MYSNILITGTQESSIDLSYLPPIPLVPQSSNNDLRRNRRSRNSLYQIPSSNDLHKHVLRKDTWPSVSRDNWVKVMVVADGPMLKYHGDKLERYILTLMQTVNCSLHEFVHYEAQLNFLLYLILSQNVRQIFLAYCYKIF